MEIRKFIGITLPLTLLGISRSAKTDEPELVCLWR